MRGSAARIRLARDRLSRLCVVLSEGCGVQARSFQMRGGGRVAEDEAMMKRETVGVVRVLLAVALVSRGSRAHAGLAGLTVLARREGAQLCGGGWLAVLVCWLEGWKSRCREAPRERFGQ